LYEKLIFLTWLVIVGMFFTIQHFHKTLFASISTGDILSEIRLLETFWRVTFTQQYIIRVCTLIFSPFRLYPDKLVMFTSIRVIFFLLLYTLSLSGFNTDLFASILKTRSRRAARVKWSVLLLVSAGPRVRIARGACASAGRRRANGGRGRSGRRRSRRCRRTTAKRKSRYRIWY